MRGNGSLSDIDVRFVDDRRFYDVGILRTTLRKGKVERKTIVEKRVVYIIIIHVDVVYKKEKMERLRKT